MKRSPSLIHLSREHHSALVLSKRAQRMHTASSEEAQRFMDEIAGIFERELEPHFQVEEDALLPALKNVGQIALAGRTQADHEELRTLVSQLGAGDATCLRQFGKTLANHVHFEEHELFPIAESVLTPEALASIEQSSHHPTTHPQGVCPMSQPTHLHLSPDAIYPFDARGIAKRFRHAAIFGALDALNPGETMRFCNDHDPLPLLDQLQQRYGEKVDIRYLQREPGAIVIDFVKS